MIDECVYSLGKSLRIGGIKIDQSLKSYKYESQYNLYGDVSSYLINNPSKSTQFLMPPLYIKDAIISESSS